MKAHSLSDHRQRGFTLVEIMVVAAIITLAGAYFSNFLINRLSYQKVRVIANEMLTLSRAMSTYYSEFRYWPGFNNDPNNPKCNTSDAFSGSVQAGLPPQVGLAPDYVMGIDESLYELDCTQPSKIVVTRTIDSAEIGEILESYLPTGMFVPGDTQANTPHKIELHVVRPRLPLSVDFFEVSSQGSNSVTIPFPADCLAQFAAISVSTDAVCTNSGDPIGGYRIDASKNSSNWSVTLRTRSDQGSNYWSVASCDGKDILFRGMTFCERN